MSNKEPFAQFLDYLITKFTSGCTFVTDPTNIIIGETPDMIGLNDGKFPRLEILIAKLAYGGFLDQRTVQQSFRISIGGHIRRTQDTTTSSDMYSLIQFGTELANLVYSAHTDKMNGVPICDGFIQIGGFPELFFEYELFPKISTVLLVAEAEIQLTDIYTNN